MSDRRRNDVAVALEVVPLAGKATQRARNVGGDRRLLGDDEFLGHAGERPQRILAKPAAVQPACCRRPTRAKARAEIVGLAWQTRLGGVEKIFRNELARRKIFRSEEHTSELQSHVNLVCRLLLEKKKKRKK